MKVLFLGNKRKYRGRGPGYNGDMFITLFKEELARQHDVLFWGWGYQYDWESTRRRNIFELFDFFGKPDVIMTLCVTDFSKIGLNKVKNVPKVHFIGDFYPGMTGKEYDRHMYLYMTIGYDLFLSPNVIINEYIQQNISGRKYVLWPWSVDINFFKNFRNDREIDCCFMGSTWEALYGSGRKNVCSILKRLAGNHWIRKCFFDDYVNVLNNSKIFISNNFKLKYWPKKVLEVMACGCMLLTDHYIDYDYFGFENYKHMVLYKDFDEMVNMIGFYIVNGAAREEIAKTGRDYVCNNFNTVRGVETLTNILQKEL